MIFKLELSPENFHYDVLNPLYSEFFKWFIDFTINNFFIYLGNVVEMKNSVATGNSQISFTDQVLNMKEFTSLIQSEATGPSNTTQQTGTRDK